MSTKQPFLLHVDQLKNGKEEDISETIAPSFLDLKEEDEIQAKEPISVKGQAYIAGDFLILSLALVARLELKCSTCNESFSLDIDLPRFLHEEPLEAIKHGVFDYGNLVRETILLEVPFYPLCGGKACLHRDRIEKYLKTEENSSEVGYHPFQNIDI